MIILEEGTIVLGDKVEKIIRFEVWWKGPTGLVPQLNLALQTHPLLRLDDVPFHMAWRATAVAIGDKGGYEEVVG